MNQEYRDKIAAQFKRSVDGTITRITSKKQSHRPFHTALLSEEVIFWSAFERSFSTSFGQGAVEEIAYQVALANGATEAKRQKETIITIDTAYEQAITDHIQKLRDGSVSDYSWDTTLNNIRSVTPSGQTQTLRVISDLWWKKDGIDHFISLKTVQPNLDQTAEAKRDCLHLSIALPTCKTYFGLWYNPFGDNRSDYNFSFPKSIFNFDKDVDVVLIGKEMWDTIGGDGCYEELLQIAASVGQDTKESIKGLKK